MTAVLTRTCFYCFCCAICCCRCRGWLSAGNGTVDINEFKIWYDDESGARSTSDGSGTLKAALDLKRIGNKLHKMLGGGKALPETVGRHVHASSSKSADDLISSSFKFTVGGKTSTETASGTMAKVFFEGSAPDDFAKLGAPDGCKVVCYIDFYLDDSADAAAVAGIDALLHEIYQEMVVPMLAEMVGGEPVMEEMLGTLTFKLNLVEGTRTARLSIFPATQADLLSVRPPSGTAQRHAVCAPLAL